MRGGEEAIGADLEAAALFCQVAALDNLGSRLSTGSRGNLQRHSLDPGVSILARASKDHVHPLWGHNFKGRTSLLLRGPASLGGSLQKDHSKRFTTLKAKKKKGFKLKERNKNERGKPCQFCSMPGHPSSR